ncbi:AroM family protein [Brevibacterium luteolum]|uniref:AroM family protein n=1 Tax=Brevibacterium luteolum TaxID=199591 RepID=A0A2N6PE30_9MICO|nr:AroM family protein [Brevibacterium luteolum]PMB96937.1 hypothetical protein CJ198_13745 [Brevibacterium luteolum]
MSVLGVVTIGQAPREDIARSFAPHFDRAGIGIVQAGALDGLSEETIRSALAPSEGETTYITRLLSGTSVELAKRHVVPLLQQRINELESQCDAVVVVCTGDFPMLTSGLPLYFPDQLLLQAARDRQLDGGLGLVVPLSRQTEDISAKWDELGVTVHTAVATPYGEADLAAAAAVLAVHRPGLIVLDCMGYTVAHGQAVREASECEVLVPQEFIPRYVAQKLGEAE